MIAQLKGLSEFLPDQVPSVPDGFKVINYFTFFDFEGNITTKPVPRVTVVPSLDPYGLEMLINRDSQRLFEHFKHKKCNFECSCEKTHVDNNEVVHPIFCGNMFIGANDRFANSSPLAIRPNKYNIVRNKANGVYYQIEADNVAHTRNLENGIIPKSATVAGISEQKLSDLLAQIPDFLKCPSKNF